MGQSAHIALFVPLQHERDEPEQRGYRANVENDAAAALLAVHTFQEQRSTECGVDLTADLYDSHFSASKAAGELRRILDNTTTTTTTTMDNGSTDPLVALIGSFSSSSAAPLALLAGVYDIPTIGTAATTTDLDRKDQYPLFARMIPNTAATARAAVDYLLSLEYRHVNLLYVTE